MRSEALFSKPMFKAAVAVIVFALLGAFIGHKMSPEASVIQLVSRMAMIAGALLVVLVAAVISLTFWQFLLRKGATDPQWYWFKSEPRGLVQERELLRAREGAASGARES